MMIEEFEVSCPCICGVTGKWTLKEIPQFLEVECRMCGRTYLLASVVTRLEKNGHAYLECMWIPWRETMGKVVEVPSRSEAKPCQFCGASVYCYRGSICDHPSGAAHTCQKSTWHYVAQLTADPKNSCDRVLNYESIDLALEYLVLIGALDADKAMSLWQFVQSKHSPSTYGHVQWKPVTT